MGFEKVTLTVIWRVKWLGGVGGKWEKQRRRDGGRMVRMLYSCLGNWWQCCDQVTNVELEKTLKGSAKVLGRK